MLHREREVRLEIVELAAAIVTHAFELVREHVLVGEQRLDRVGELDLAARPGVWCVRWWKMRGVRI
jgi:hypothetical protein